MATHLHRRAPGELVLLRVMDTKCIVCPGELTFMTSILRVMLLRE